jgi:hypothetical protein
LAFRNYNFRCEKKKDLGLRMNGFEFRVQGSGSRIQGSGFRV